MPINNFCACEHRIRALVIPLQQKRLTMPSNKNALIIYKYLDRLLSDRHHYYTMRDLYEKVNEMLEDDGFLKVTRRCIEKDIESLQDAPFRADIETFQIDGKIIYRYRRSSFSIFREELSNEERNLLHEVLSTIGQFDGLNHFDWLEKFKMGLGLERRRQIISFSNNPYLQNTNLLGTLFDQISNMVVIHLSYHTFTDTSIRSIDFHPYLLKQYNDRWFLLGAADSDNKVLTFPLDRIDKVEPLPKMKYRKCPENLKERFEDIVGVTLYEDRECEHIVFWVSDTAKGYVITKPIHESQTQLKGEKEQKLRSAYSMFEGGLFISIDCIPNYELIRELCSFGGNLVVLSPESVRTEIKSRLLKHIEKY